MKSKTICRVINGVVVNCDDNPPPESRLQEVLSSRRMPSIKTDAQFLKNHGTLDKQFEGDKRQLDEITGTANMGITPIQTILIFPLWLDIRAIRWHSFRRTARKTILKRFARPQTAPAKAMLLSTENLKNREKQ